MSTAPVFVASALPPPTTQAMNLPPGKEGSTPSPADNNVPKPQPRRGHNRFEGSSDTKAGPTFGENDNTSAPTPTPNTTPPAGNAAPPVPQPIPKSVANAQVTRYATAFPVGPDLFLTTLAAVDGATTISLDDPQGNTFTATFVRGDDKTGLALVRVPGKKFAYLGLSDSFAGGDVQCSAFPTVAIFSPTVEVLSGHAAAIKPNDPKWLISFQRNPRLGGGPLSTSDGKIVGVEMTQRDTNPQQVPAVKLDDLKTFLGADAPNAATPGADINYILMLTATVSK
jgi:S1-C subfamily serine protease